jgi:hypothetical protein
MMYFDIPVMSRAFGAPVAGYVTAVKRYKSVQKSCQKTNKTSIFVTFSFKN